MAVTSVSRRRNCRIRPSELLAPPPPALSQRPRSRISYLSAQPHQDEREEEEQGPDWGDGQQREGLWVCHEGQARALVCHVGHVLTHVIGHEVQDGEDDEPGIDTGGTVSDADDDTVSNGEADTWSGYAA